MNRMTTKKAMTLLALVALALLLGGEPLMADSARRSTTRTRSARDSQRPDAVLFTQTQEYADADSRIRVAVDWLARPGELALTIDYYGYLVQEGMVNVYLEVNGVRREFLTCQEALPDRSQRLRLLSFHPTTGTTKGPNMLKKLPGHTMVDYLLFQQAPYYATFGEITVEVKFFAHGRWHGDPRCNNGNFRFTFASPIKGEALDHF
jgi:hypothetical protein